MNSVFRHEIKFCCRYSEADRIYQWLHSSSGAIRKQYPDRFVNNIYFDWFNLQDASDNLVGLGRREKLRLRWYGEQDAVSPMQLERKIRRVRMGSKHIVQLGAFSVSRMSKHALLQGILSRGPESAALGSELRLRNPVVRNRYLREYYQDGSGRLRLTIDREQAFYSIDRHRDVLSANRIDYPLLVIELKYADDSHAHVRSTMNGFPLRPVRHSKYLAGLARVFELAYF